MTTGPGPIPREAAVDARRWELPDVGSADAGPLAAWHPRALRQIEDVEQRAREDGYARGLAEGRDAARAELVAQVARVESLLAALVAPLEDLDATVERELVALALLTAERVVRHELATAPDRVLAAVRDSLAALPSHARQVRLHVAPQDAALLREHLAAGAGGHACEIVEDAALTPGGCHVHAEHSRVDASVESRLAALIDGVLARGDMPGQGVS